LDRPPPPVKQHDLGTVKKTAKKELTSCHRAKKQKKNKENLATPTDFGGCLSELNIAQHLGEYDE